MRERGREHLEKLLLLHALAAAVGGATDLDADELANAGSSVDIPSANTASPPVRPNAWHSAEPSGAPTT